MLRITQTLRTNPGEGTPQGFGIFLALRAALYPLEVPLDIEQKIHGYCQEALTTNSESKTFETPTGTFTVIKEVTNQGQVLLTVGYDEADTRPTPVAIIALMASKVDYDD